ncbi:MAG TPA: methyltransferase [Pyrinomonadaceae bacterium]
MDDNKQLPPSAHLTQILFGFTVSRAISVAAQFRIADYLKDGPKTADELAQRASVHPRSLYRLLRALSGAAIFSEDSAGRFSLTELGELLRSDHPQSLRGFAELIADAVNFETWAGLSYSVQTGNPAFIHQRNMPFFEWLEHNPDEATLFHNAMTSFSAGALAAVVEAYDFSGISKLVDVGGGHGLLIASLLSKYPVMKGIVYDDPKVVEGAEQVLREHGVFERGELIGGNFFASVPAGGDAYILKHIIHDWSDDECVTILRHCHKVMPLAGKVLIVEMVIPEPNVPSIGKLLDLQMLVYLSGRERTAKEYEDLLSQAGFDLQRIVPTPSPYSVIEGIKR